MSADHRKAQQPQQNPRWKNGNRRNFYHQGGQSSSFQGEDRENGSRKNFYHQIGAPSFQGEDREEWRNGNRRNAYQQTAQSSSPQCEDRDETELKSLDEDGSECERLFREFSDRMKDRLRKYVKLEADLRQRYSDFQAEAKALEEEKKVVEAWENEAAALQLKSENNLKEIRGEREQLERASTDLAIQLAELKRTQREMEKKMAKPDVVQPAITDPREPMPSVTDHKNSEQLMPLGAYTQQMPLDAYVVQTDEDVPLAKRIKLMKPTPKKKQYIITIEAALQEDAPGLYELLEERGLLEDMNIYTSEWLNETGEPSSDHDSFKQLGEVIAKHWGPTLLKDPTRSRVQAVNNSKPNYCLACLISLIEQTKVLKQRKWPVRWGWCRPLSAFLFVFEKHNRIVIERPEYGYATYFFELVQRLPVQWQVDRLIKVMSCISTSRAALLENRPLEASLLLPEEATVLEDYGWTPNTGIGSLLNFCDRVHHDYKTEDEAGEWKAKIGKLLMDGHHHGSIVANLPRKLVQPDDHQPVDQSQNQLLQTLAASAAAAADPTPQLTYLPNVKQEPCY